MKLKKLSKQKRNMLTLVVVCTLLVVAGLYVLLIKPQNESLDHLARKRAELRDRQRQMIEASRHASEIAADLTDAQARLSEAEKDIASGDLYSWVINTLRQFRGAYQVNIPQISSLGPVTDVNLLPRFPYKQTSLSLVGSAHYHDLGRFVADLENQYPHIRVVNLNLDLNAGPTQADQETVSFRMDLLTLVKPNPS